MNRARVIAWIERPAPALRLAALRIMIGGFATVYLVANHREFARLANRSPVEFEPTGIANLLDRPLNASFVWLGFGALLALGVAFTFGVAYRIVGPAFALGMLGWASYHSSWGQLLHFEHLVTVHLLVLGLSPAADALRPGATAAHPDHVRYGWPVRLLSLATVLTYVSSGLAKLRWSGLAWFDPDTMADHISYSAGRIAGLGGPTPPLASIALDQRWALPVAAAVALAVELGAPVALLGGRWRAAWTATALVFHAATGLTMWVFFGYRGLGFGLLPLFEVERLLPGRPRSLGARTQRMSKASSLGAAISSTKRS